MSRRVYAADLHVHSVLSPCGDLEMSPGRILERAKAIGLDLIAITDHNMVENGAALRTLAADGPVSVLYGMELETVEEVHLICLFDAPDVAVGWQELVYARLPDMANDAARFGDQVVVDENEEILRFESRLLTNATTIPFDEACEEVSARGGLVIPAHIDRPSHSVVSQLGFLPPGVRVDAVEVTRNASEAFLTVHSRWLRGVPIVRFSDAHFLYDIGAQRTLFEIEAPTVAELGMALRGEQGRGVVERP